MIDRVKFIGHKMPGVSVAVEKGQLTFFAKATGETNPIYFDEDAAMAAGHPTLPAPPTFAFTLNALARAKAGPGGYMPDMGINIAHVLHGEQAFDYHATIYAGDVMTVAGTITDIYDKKGGAMEFIVMTIDAVNQNGVLCVQQHNTLVVRNPGAAK